MQSGIHHITAIAGEPRRNVAFYTGLLGLRLVKKTVNFDDPGTYHLYYGDESGQPGTVLTFFPWAGVPRGKPGAGEVTRVDLQAPVSAQDFWRARIGDGATSANDAVDIDRNPVIDFADPDGMALRIVFRDPPSGAQPWHTAEIAAANALTGFFGAAMTLANSAATEAILRGLFQFERGAAQGDAVRLQTGAAASGTHLDLITAGATPRGVSGAGSVHHIAFRAPDDARQAAMAQKLQDSFGLDATEQRDRNYFRSVYFREPSGVLFEIATDDPGFAVDEPFATLGQALKLPPQYEPHRARIAQVLPPLD